jgi:FKBP-type peptidyl-prolyl cis-trans isomerase SlyD
VLYLTEDLDLVRAQLFGERPRYDAVRALLDNVSTDEITPAWAYCLGTDDSSLLDGVRGGLQRRSRSESDSRRAAGAAARPLQRKGLRGKEQVPMAVSEIPIVRDTFVTVEYSVYNDDGELVDQSAGDRPLSYVHGYGQIVAGLERALEGLRKGQTRSVVLSPELAYGVYDPDGVLEVERSDFPESADLAVGDEFVAQSPGGDELPLTVIDVRSDAVVVDTNHPLAGETLRFDVTVLDVRAATHAEIADAHRTEQESTPLVALGRKRGDTTLLS